MKTLKFILSAFFIAVTLFASAQADTIHVTLSAKHFGFINRFSPDKGDPVMVNLFNSVADQLEVIDSAGRKWVKDTAQLITVVAEADVIPRLFIALGSQQERFATNLNNEIRDALLPQLMRKPELFNGILGLVLEHQAITWQLIQQGLDYLIQIKR